MLTRRTPSLIVAAALVVAAVDPAAGPVAAADCNANGTDDFAEVTGGSAPDCNRNGVPDPCEILPVNRGFSPRTGIPAVGFPGAILAQDLDGDGNVDIAALISGGLILVAWNDTQGGYTIQWSSTHEEGFNTFLAVGDLDMNGLADIVVGSLLGATSLFQDAARSFVLRSHAIEAPSSLGALALADFDGDGDRDLALTGAFEVLVFPNTGGGTFGEAKSLPAGSSPLRVIAADLNGDGDPDLATTNRLELNGTASVSVFLNRGGTFSAARNFAVGQAPASLIAGDLDGDGPLDLVATNPAGSEISILMGRGDGTFGERTRMRLPSPFQAALGDLDGDLDLDIAVSRVASPNEVSPGGVASVLWNHGNRVHRHAGDFPLGSSPGSIAIADVTGDGDPEIVAAAGNGIQVLGRSLVPYAKDCDANGVPDDCDLRTGDCNGNGIPDRCDIASLGSRDCDRDGIPDECEPDCNGNGVADDCDVSATTSGDCNGNGVPDECDVTPGEMGSHRFFLTGPGPPFASMTTGDMDADGRPDLVVLEPGPSPQPGSDVNVLWNAGNLAFEPITTAARLRQGSLVAPGDFDGDGDLDLAGGSPGFQSLVVILQSDRRAFVEGAVLVLDEGMTGLCSADFDGDGRADVAAAGASGDLHLAPGRADGTIGPARRTAAGLGPGALTAADMDRDGAVDIACILENDAPGVLWNEGGASFTKLEGLSATGGARSVATGDLDGDGDLDMAVFGPMRIVVFLQTGRRTFVSTGDAGSSGLTALISADFDGDGLDDLITAHAVQPVSPANGVELHRSWGDGVFDPASSFQLLSGNGFATLAALDIDADGGMELVAGLERPSRVKAFILRMSGSPPASRDRNRNGRPDECEAGAFRRGDADGDGVLNLADAVFSLRALFQGGPAPGCTEAADTDNDGAVNVSDPIAILEHLFRGGPPSAAPGPPPGPCGLDTDPPGSPADLGCAAYEGC
jgi:hypothetical protein